MTGKHTRESVGKDGKGWVRMGKDGNGKAHERIVKVRQPRVRAGNDGKGWLRTGK